jgi:hypothetical protein
MKIGIVFCAYGNSEYVEPCLKNWIKLKDQYSITIAAVHSQFKEYHDMEVPDHDFETLSKLAKLNGDKIIDYLWVNNTYNGWSNPIYPVESEARNYPLFYLLNKKVNYIWLLDLDEFYTEKDIINIIDYIKKEDNEFYTWFSINFKNYIFDGKQWVDGFCPPRIFKVESNNHKLLKFYWDNDMIYQDLLTNSLIRSYKDLVHKEIPRNIVNGGIKHLTWLNFNGKEKVQYQRKHFGYCSYSWNDETNQLEFDLNYYNKLGISIPNVYND